MRNEAERNVKHCATEKVVEVEAQLLEQIINQPSLPVMTRLAWQYSIQRSMPGRMGIPLLVHCVRRHRAPGVSKKFDTFLKTSFFTAHTYTRRQPTMMGRERNNGRPYPKRSRTYNANQRYPREIKKATQQTHELNYPVYRARMDALPPL